MEVKKEAIKVKHEVYSSGVSIKTLSRKTLARDLAVCEEWKLSIDLKLPNRSITKWRNVFSLIFYDTTAYLEHRILAVSIRPGQSNVELKIANDMFAKPVGVNTVTNTVTKKVNADNWINLKMSQMGGLYEIKVDYKVVYNKTNAVSEAWPNVRIVTGNTDVKEHFMFDVYYRNFKINSCKTKSKILGLRNS